MTGHDTELDIDRSLAVIRPVLDTSPADVERLLAELDNVVRTPSFTVDLFVGPATGIAEQIRSTLPPRDHEAAGLGLVIGLNRAFTAYNDEHRASRGTLVLLGSLAGHDLVRVARSRKRRMEPQALRADYENGVPVTKLAEQCGVSLSTMYRRLRRAGTTFGPPGPRCE
ncbi:hypothetical protein [Amycolatopsis samaneae]|uniref:Uncharacterized protein n=1 Tax=Amycolatopsis samaneae TaxID=664691 RepID=A0ABW5GDY5_9PSEU